MRFLFALALLAAGTVASLVFCVLYIQSGEYVIPSALSVLAAVIGLTLLRADFEQRQIHGE